MNLIDKIKNLPNAIQGYERSDPTRNGEYKFIKSYIKNNMIIFDAGANIGYYAKYILNLNSNIKIHCFEPTSITYQELIINMQKKIDEGKAVCNNFGLSDESGTAEMFIYDELDERNSLHLNKEHKFNSEKLHKETINLITIDKYASEHNISKIDFLKIDVEGHETKVIKGATSLIEKGLVKCIQFEYNNNWAAAGFTLEDIFNYLSKNDFKFFRLAIWGKIPIRRFNKKLENYKHANYIAILKDFASN